MSILRGVRITYIINFGNLYHDYFNTLYIRKEYQGVVHEDFNGYYGSKEGVSHEELKRCESRRLLPICNKMIEKQLDSLDKYIELIKDNCSIKELKLQGIEEKHFGIIFTLHISIEKVL